MVSFLVSDQPEVLASSSGCWHGERWTDSSAPSHSPALHAVPAAGSGPPNTHERSSPAHHRARSVNVPNTHRGLFKRNYSSITHKQSKNRTKLLFCNSNKSVHWTSLHHDQFYWNSFQDERPRYKSEILIGLPTAHGQVDILCSTPGTHVSLLSLWKWQIVSCRVPGYC